MGRTTEQQNNRTINTINTLCMGEIDRTTSGIALRDGQPAETAIRAWGGNPKEKVLIIGNCDKECRDTNIFGEGKTNIVSCNTLQDIHGKEIPPLSFIFPRWRDNEF